MPYDVAIIIGLVAPIVLFTLFRINAVMVFLSLCLGEVLVRYVASDANSMLSLFAPGISPIGLSMVQLIVLLLPVVLTSIFMVLSIEGSGKIVTNILPAAGVGLLGVLLVVPLLPNAAQSAIQQGAIWPQLAKLQALIVGFTAVLSLVYVWSQRRKHKFGKEK